MNDKNINLNFQYWSDLAKKDPEAFEKKRKEVIDQYITTLPNKETQARINKLQWRIDMERKKYKNPLDAAIRIYDMMWTSVSKHYDVLQSLTDITSSEQPKKAKIEKAPILPFKKFDPSDKQTGS